MILVIVCIICASLATFVLTLMLKDLDGPFDIFKRLRKLICIYDDNNIPISFFAKLFDCPWCLGTWVSAGVSIVTVAVFTLSFVWFFYMWLVGVAITGLLYRYVMD